MLLPSPRGIRAPAAANLGAASRTRFEQLGFGGAFPCLPDSRICRVNSAAASDAYLPRRRNRRETVDECMFVKKKIQWSVTPPAIPCAGLVIFAGSTTQRFSTNNEDGMLGTETK